MAGHQLTLGNLRTELIGKCPEKKFDALFHHTIDSLIRSSTPDYTKYSEVWTLEDWFGVLSDLKQIITIFSRSNLKKDELDETLAALPEPYRESIFQCLSLRKDDLQAALVEQTLSISESYLRDFDWKIKYALASDKISSVEEPLVNLSLTVNEEGTNRTIPLEMNVNELKSFITSLEAAHKAVLQLKS
ncbi:COMM domain-containing protein 8-like [Apostichopus japonicus]|uniref:COMM domain-containing protein 8-like n=1 Tax=Stichopus japonicus TaxID=307972 RepID=UPI003AB8290E